MIEDTHNLIILVGLPGSGKTTHCTTFPDYSRISQDDLGSRGACINKFIELAKEKRDIIVDRTNVTRKQRKLWIDLGKKYGYTIECHHLLEEPAVCLERIKNRKNHPTITISMPDSKKEEIINKFVNEYEDPMREEGFFAVSTYNLCVNPGWSGTITDFKV